MQSNKSKGKMDALNKLAVLNERIYQVIPLKEQFQDPSALRDF